MAFSVRERLPSKRKTAHYDVELATSSGRLKCHLSCCLYPDGRLGAVAVSHGKAGNIIRTMLTMWARTASIALQNGAPVSNVVSTLADVHDETGGRLNLPEVPAVHNETCTSVWDAISKILDAEFCS